MNTLCIDLSHYDGPGTDYRKLKEGGIVGIIYKATQGSSITDSTYKTEKRLALSAGLLWGSYHFGDNSDPTSQAIHYVSFAQPDPGELFCLDFEDNGTNSMGIEQARTFISALEGDLNRGGECVLYSGNRIKDLLGSKKDAFFGERRLWLAQYGTGPEVQASWSAYWLWQYTDGVNGPTPHTIPGAAASGVDCNNYDGTPEQLAAEWASGIPVPPPAPLPPSQLVVTLTIDVPPGVTVNVVQQPTVGSFASSESPPERERTGH